MKYIKYLNYVMRHKLYVAGACWLCAIYSFSFRLAWLGIVHDWSKLLPSEFIPYAGHFYGNSGMKEGRDHTGYYEPAETKDEAFKHAWFLHQNRNKHHWQWWVIPKGDGQLEAIQMPLHYLIEMVCDWVGAGRSLRTKGVDVWYEANKGKLLLHKNTRLMVESLVLVFSHNDVEHKQGEKIMDLASKL